MFLKKNLTVLFIPALLLLLSLNCSGPVRKDMIPERKFVNVLADIHLADGIGAEVMNNIYTEYILDSASFYGSVLKKYKVTPAEFDNTLAFYSSHPNDCQRMYNKVIARLKDMEEELKREEQELQRQRKEQSADSTGKR